MIYFQSGKKAQFNQNKLATSFKIVFCWNYVLVMITFTIFFTTKYLYLVNIRDPFLYVTVHTLIKMANNYYLNLCKL